MNHDNTDKVINFIKEALDSRKLLPGDRLPAERKLSEQLGVSRTTVRQSLQKLELYGIVRTMPQSGTFVSSFPKKQLNLLINNAIEVGRYDFDSLMSVRVLLEAEALRLCALNHTEQDLDNIVAAFTDFEQNLNTDRRQEADFNFHLTISKGARNPVIHSMLLSIIPDTLRYYEKLHLCRSVELRTRAEHREMIDYISSKGTSEKSPRELLERHLNIPRS
ncbi:MAG: FadR family transcriptional regulator [Muribaculaceae bacterium]|nr:FadR family transcriptional regulator [Muribaculaceae bacterium]